MTLSDLKKLDAMAQYFRLLLCSYRLTESDQILHPCTGVYSPSERGGIPELPMFGDLLLKPTPFDLERTNSARQYM